MKKLSILGIMTLLVLMCLVGCKKVSTSSAPQPVPQDTVAIAVCDTDSLTISGDSLSPITAKQETEYEMKDMGEIASDVEQLAEAVKTMSEAAIWVSHAIKSFQ